VPLPDACDDERADDGGQDAEPGLGEAESDVGGGQHDVGHRAEAHATPQRGALDARDDGHRAVIDGAQHVRHAPCVRLVVLQRQGQRGTHPLDVGPGAERGSLPRQHDGAQRLRRLGGQVLERLPQLIDEGGVERVAHLRACQGDARHDAVTLQAQHAAHRGSRP
jgi:hypothetical protein